MLWILRQQAVENSTFLQVKAANLNHELVLANQETAGANQIRSRIAEITARNQELGGERAELAGPGSLADILETISGGLPPGAVLTRVTAQPTRIDIEGRAPGRQDIVSYVQNLEIAALFKEVRIALIDVDGQLDQTGFRFRLFIDRGNGEARP